jgi:shikimate 5-dehydrogenase
VAFAWSRLAMARRHQGLPVAPLQVAGRDGAKAADVAGLAGPGAQAVDWAATAELVAAAEVVVQATTLTARGEPVPGQDRLRPGVRVLDCNYGPASRGLVTAARAAGAAAAADGLGMLCAQAAGAVVKIARVRPDLDAMAAAVGLSWPVPGSAGDPPD